MCGEVSLHEHASENLPRGGFGNMVLMGSYWTRPERLTVSSRVAMSAISLRLKTLWILYSCDALLERLAQHLQDVVPELRQFIQKENTVVRQRYIARPRQRTATDQPYIRDGEMWRATGAGLTKAVRSRANLATL
jgi:hypothetical protein